MMSARLDSQPIRSTDPRTGDRRDLPFGPSTPGQVDSAAEHATQATRQLNRLIPAERASLLRDMAARLDAHREELVAIADRESALGRPRLGAELDRTISQLDLFARVVEDGHCFEITIDHADPNSTPLTPDLRRLLIAVGPVAVFGASNFPFAFSAAGGDTASALAAGCAAVVKAHPAHPQLDTDVVGLLGEVAAEHGLPTGTISAVHGRDAGSALVAHPAIKAVGFTGSESGGRTLMDLAARRPEPIPVYAEMGALNPLVVSKAVAARDPAAVAQGIANSVTLGHGQFCTKPGVVYLPDIASGDAVISELASLLREHPPQPMLSFDIRDGYRANVRRLQAIGPVRAHVPDREPDGGGTSAAAALSEVSASDLFIDGALLAECFGPATLVVRYRDRTELLRALAGMPGTLTLSVLADPGSDADLLTHLDDLAMRRAGRLIFGGFPTGVAVTWAQTHGGPYPAASSQFTSVGATAIRRFQRPMTYQDWPNAALPPHLRENNPLHLPRRIDGHLQPATPAQPSWPAAPRDEA